MRRVRELIAGVLLLAACGAPPSPQAPAKLWSYRCGGCHVAHSPAAYGDASWMVVVRHMRVRAYLTADEEEALRAFLQASN